ncbi:TPA: hypothetical protein KDY90_002565 [Vibrio parahaemolyticus]|nr:hypothetical protein [Vibrio parahaemolyticus]
MKTTQQRVVIALENDVNDLTVLAEFIQKLMNLADMVDAGEVSHRLCAFYKDASAVQQASLAMLYAACGAWIGTAYAMKDLRAAKEMVIREIAWKQNRLEVAEGERPELVAGLTIYEVVRTSRVNDVEVSREISLYSTKSKAMHALEKKHALYVNRKPEDEQYTVSYQSDDELELYREDTKHEIAFKIKPIDVA